MINQQESFSRFNEFELMSRIKSEKFSDLFTRIK